MTTTANKLDLSALPPASRRELLDFYQFLLERRVRVKKMRKPKKASPTSAADCSGKETP